MNANSDHSVNLTSRPGHPALWAGIGVLGTTVVALAATLFWVQRPTTAPVLPLTQVAAALPSSLAGSPAESSATPNASRKEAMVQDGPPDPVASPSAKALEKKPAPVKTAAAPRPAPRSEPTPVATAPVAGPAAGPAPVSAPVSAPVVAPVVAAAPEPVKPVCASCGTVESVTPVQREVAGTGLGAVAGGVLGAVVGNQVGQGSGRTAATVLGAVGGALGGNMVEKRMKKETIYQVSVRMENGQLRTLERASAVSVGSRVTVDGDSLRTTDGALVPAPAPARAAAQPAPAANPQPGG